MYMASQTRNLRGDFLKRQEGRCAICGDPFPRRWAFWRKPVLDHDHRTGGFRGVLCSSCNKGLGFFCDSPELLQKAIKYLKIPRVARFPRRLTVSDVTRGRKASEETRQKLSKLHKGSRHSKETRRKISEGNYRRWAAQKAA